MNTDLANLYLTKGFDSEYFFFLCEQSSCKQSIFYIYFTIYNDNGLNWP